MSTGDADPADDATGHVGRGRRTWARWLNVIVSVPVLALCALLPIRRGEEVYRFLLEFREKYAEYDWAVVVACRWVAWGTLVVAVIQVGLLVALVIRLRRRTLVASYATIALLTALFLVWAYFMAPSASLMDGVQKPS